MLTQMGGERFPRTQQKKLVKEPRLPSVLPWDAEAQGNLEGKQVGTIKKRVTLHMN